MTLPEAINTEKPFKRKHWNNWLQCDKFGIVRWRLPIIKLLEVEMGNPLVEGTNLGADDWIVMEDVSPSEASSSI